jgi:hypothetical protein
MINRNLTLHKNESGYWLRMSRLDEYELAKLVRKHDGLVNVKISRPVSPGTDEQNRAAHALMQEYFLTGMFSYPAKSLAELKIYLKIAYGSVYDMIYKGEEIKVPKSWRDFSKQERHNFINGLLAEIHASGAYAESEEIRNIIAGMEAHE